MPCRDADWSPPSYYDEARKFEAMLCGIVTAIENQGFIDRLLDQVDWKEAGVTKTEFVEWRKKHLREDTERREREKQEAITKRLQEQAINKLTPEERNALGIR